MIVFQTPESKKAVFDYYMSIVEWKSLTPVVKFSVNNDVLLLLVNGCILKFRTSYASNVSTIDGILNLEFQDYFGEVDSTTIQYVIDSLNSYAPYWSIKIYNFYRELWKDSLHECKLFMVDDSGIAESRIYCSWMCYTS